MRKYSHTILDTSVCVIESSISQMFYISALNVISDALAVCETNKRQVNPSGPKHKKQGANYRLSLRAFFVLKKLDRITPQALRSSISELAPTS